MRVPGPGSIVDLIAPSSSFDREGFERGLEWLRAQGFRPRHRADVLDRDRFLAGPDERRRDELLAALDAPDSDLVWCARGGYGATRLLDSLPLERIRRAGKVLVGFSDITALHARWLAASVPSIHGSMVARLATEPADVVAHLMRMLRPGAIASPLAGHDLAEGRAEGVLAGGNLAVLAAVCGTPYQPDFRGAIVAVEDTGERPYRLDRMFVQLRQAGVFRGIAGLAFGEFDRCDDASGPQSIDVLREHARALGVPAVSGLPFGHGAVNMALPFGRRARLAHGRLEFLEPLFPAAVS